MTQKEKISNYDRVDGQREMAWLALSDVLNENVYWIEKGKLGICRWNSRPLVITKTAYWHVEDLDDFYNYWSNYDGSHANSEVVAWRDLAISVRPVFNKLISGELK